jgi:hypothetical protein
MILQTSSHIQRFGCQSACSAPEWQSRRENDDAGAAIDLLDRKLIVPLDNTSYLFVYGFPCGLVMSAHGCIVTLFTWGRILFRGIVGSDIDTRSSIF